MKRCLSFILVIIISISMGGCFTMHKKESKNEEKQEEDYKELYKPERIKGDIKNYLKKKYNEDFTIISILGKEWLDPVNVASVYAYPTKGDKEKDRFRADRTLKDGKFEYKDTYFGIKIRDEYNERIENILKKYFANYRISSTFMSKYFPNKFNGSKTLQNAIDEGADLFGNVRILTEPQDKDKFNKNVEEFSKELLKLKQPMSVIVFDSKTEDLNSFDSDDMQYSMSRFITIGRDGKLELDDLDINTEK